MILVIRTMLFYTLSICALVLFASTVTLVSPLVKKHKLQYILTQYNVFVLWLSRCICGLRYKIEGLENIQKGPFIVLSNHQSSLETFLLQTLFSPLSTVLKQELLKLPFFAWGAKQLKAIPLDRNEPTKAYKQLIKEGRERISENRSVLIFPEGTRVAIGKKVKFNRGGAALAYHAKVPIIPIAHNAGLRLMPNSFILTPGVITVRIGQAISSNDRSKRELYELSTAWIEHQRDALL